MVFLIEDIGGNGKEDSNTRRGGAVTAELNEEHHAGKGLRGQALLEA